jgi:hypothetical protein
MRADVSHFYGEPLRVDPLPRSSPRAPSGVDPSGDAGARLDPSGGARRPGDAGARADRS